MEYDKSSYCCSGLIERKYFCDGSDFRLHTEYRTYLAYPLIGKECHNITLVINSFFLAYCFNIWLICLFIHMIATKDNISLKFVGTLCVNLINKNR